jgi:hypothetical protein
MKARLRHKKTTLLLLVGMFGCFLLMAQDNKYRSLIQNTWKELPSLDKKEYRYIAYNGKEDTASNYVLHEFKENGTIFTTTHYSNKAIKLRGPKASDNDEPFIEEEKWQLKENELTWYVRSALFGKPVSVEENNKYKIIKLSQNEMILKRIESQNKTQ